MKRNVILICLDSVRKDVFDQRASDIDTRSDISLSQCRAASSWSPSSHGSLLTGMLPSVHGVNSNEFDYSVIGRENTFISNLDGFETIGVSANTHASSVFNFDRFFDVFCDVAGGSLFPSGMNIKAECRTIDSGGVAFARSLLSRCLKNPNSIRSIGNILAAKAESLSDGKPLPGFLDNGASTVSHRTLAEIAAATEPVFVFTNFMEAHEPYRTKRFYGDTDVPNSWSSTEVDKWDINTGSVANPEYIKRYRMLYKQSIGYIDRVVATLIDDIRRQTDRETTIIVTADHGQNLGFEYEGGLVGHKASLSEGLLHVPFEIVNPPDSLEIDHNRLQSHLDIGSLITSIAHGTSFEPSISEKCLPAEILGIGSELNKVPEDERTYWNRTIRCIYDEDEKIEWDSLGNTLRFELSDEHPSWQRQLEKGVDIPDCASKIFDHQIREIGQRSNSQLGDDVTDAVRDQMQELGYL